MRSSSIIFMLLPFCISAQADYLVNTRGDTLKGQISFQLVGNLEQALVKGVKRETFSAVVVREVFLKGNRYKPVQYAGTIKFMQIISDGYLSLLAFQPQGIMNYDGRLLQKRDGSVLEVPSLGFKKQMSSFLKDHDPLAKKITDGTLDRKDLDKIISEYNQFIAGKTNAVAVQSKIEMKQKSKLELLNDLKTEIDITALESKADVMDMLADVEEKIKGNKPLPNYLVQALKGRISNQALVQSKFEILMEALK